MGEDQLVALYDMDYGKLHLQASRETCAAIPHPPSCCALNMNIVEVIILVNSFLVA